jgi:hypothetical protein
VSERERAALLAIAAIQSGGRRLVCVATFYRLPNARKHLRERERKDDGVEAFANFVSLSVHPPAHPLGEQGPCVDDNIFNIAPRQHLAPLAS